MKKNQLLFLLAICFAAVQGFSQNTNKLVKYTSTGTTTGPSSLIETITNTVPRLGFPNVTNTAGSYFEIRRITPTTYVAGSLLKLNEDFSTSQNSPNFIDFFYTDLGIKYGIFQSSASIRNYFAGKAGIGVLPNEYQLNVRGTIGSDNIMLTGNGGGYIGSTQNILNFSVSPTPNAALIKIELTDIATRFYNKIIPDEFQMTRNAGIGKVLVSDLTGNGSWTSIGDLTINDNDWLRNERNDLYSNCRYVGIGTVAPTRELDVIGDIALSGGIYGKPSDKAWNKLQLWGSSNEEAGYIELGDGSKSGIIPAKWWNVVKLIAPGEGGHLEFWTNTSIKMLIRESDILLGDPDNLIDLKVNGRIFSQEVKVSLTKWSDIVFADDYQLMTLKDVDSFIKLNNHLPEIPSEKEVLENGINVGEMNALLLKKIEELTLYIIDQQKQIDELKICIQK